MKRSALTCFLTGVLLLFNSCSRNPVTGSREFMLMSEDQEIAMGKQSDPEIISQFGLYEDERLQRFITEKGQAMAAISHRSQLPYEFKIVDSPVINAFAVPGGYVYFTRGIMAHFNNEAEFAGVLGHEIGHITARHSAQQYSKTMLAQVGLIGGMIISPEIAQFGQELSQGVGLLLLKYGRDAERESDRLGVEYSTKIGYDAQQMAGFFNTLQRKQEESGASPLPSFLSSHPSPADRNATVSKLAAEWQQKAGATNFQVNRNSYLKMIDGIIYGEDPKQGFVENSVFYHPELRFQFPIPQGWSYQNSPSQVQMAPKDGNAAMILTLAPGETLEAAAQQMLQNYQLQLVESRNVTVNGLPALAMVADQKQEQGVIRTLTYLIRHENNNYSLMGIAAANNFNNYASAFTSSMQSFNVLRDQEKLNRQPERVRVKTVRQTGTLAQVFRSHQVPDARMEEMAILNGMRLNDQVTQGTLIKVVER